MAKLSDKSELVEKAAAVFRMKGYSATSIDDIAKACGITKGSIYHHFPGKEELALAALSMVRDYYRTHIFSILNPASNLRLEDLDQFNKAIENFFNEHRDGCLLANLSLEAGAAGVPFKHIIQQYFQEWRGCYMHFASQFMESEEAKTWAEDTLAAVQGCILMGRLKGDFRSLEREHARMLSYCDSFFNAGK